jgi:hypothetical protein
MFHLSSVSTGRTRLTLGQAQDRGGGRWRSNSAHPEKHSRAKHYYRVGVLLGKDLCPMLPAGHRSRFPPVIRVSNPSLRFTDQAVS